MTVTGQEEAKNQEYYEKIAENNKKRASEDWYKPEYT
jgi:hypothetical protein